MKKHAKQVAAWGQLSGLCHTLGDSYNPSKESMKGTALDDLLRQSQESVSAVHIAEAFLKEAITTRREIFARLPDVGTRVIGALEATGATLERIKDVNEFRKRFRYQTLPKGATAQKNGPGGQSGQVAGDSSPTAKRKIAYGDFDSKINNFESMIRQLEQSPSYAPLEAELSIAGLEKFRRALIYAHEYVAKMHLEVYQAKQKRDALLFGTDGMHTQARLVKKYVRSVYGFKSKEFQAIRKIKFQK